MKTATEKQLAFLNRLFDEAMQKSAKVADQNVLAEVTASIESVQDVLVLALGNAEISSQDASRAIDTLINVSQKITNVLVRSEHAGLARLNPQKVIANKFAKDCHFCNVKVAASEGFAVLSNGWLTVCKPCADTSPEELENRRREAAAKHAAEVQAQRNAEWEAERLYANEVKVFALDLFNRAGVADAAKPDLHIAIPSATGNNDLDFFRVVRNGSNVGVYRIIGGHQDQRLSLNAAHKVLFGLLFLSDHEIVKALSTYGQEIGRCGVCHRHLTDEESRAKGVGPNCAARLGF